MYSQQKKPWFRLLVHPAKNISIEPPKISNPFRQMKFGKETLQNTALKVIFIVFRQMKFGKEPLLKANR